MLCATCRESFGTIGKYFEHQKAYVCNLWREVVELKAAGEEAAADRQARKAMGVYIPMTEEAKAKLKVYMEEHKEEIAARAKLKRMTEKKLMANLQNNSKTIKRKC